MATVRDLIRGSLRLVGAIATGETPSADELSDAFSVLNDMVESWSTERLLVFEKVRREFSLVAGTASYTIGTGGTFNAPRPIRIENAAIEDQSASPTVEYPIEVLNREKWDRIPTKDLQSTIPAKLFIDDAYPLATITLYPVPTVANKLVIYPWEVITAFSSVSATVSLPPGYARALRYNLAVELAPEYGKALDPKTLDIAAESKANIKRANIKPNFLECDAGTLDRRFTFDIRSGGYR